MNLNKVIIVGRLGKAPEIRKTPGGISVTAFGVATSQTWKDKTSGQNKEQTEWHNVVLWGRSAEIAVQFLIKGSEVLIEGRLQTREWQDKQGVKRRTTEIIGERMQLGAKPKNAASASRVVAPTYADDKPIDLGQEPSQDLPVVQTGDETEENLPFPF